MTSEPGPLAAIKFESLDGGDPIRQWRADKVIERREQARSFCLVGPVQQ